MPGFPMVDMYIKNETASKSETLKHRFVWALILWAVTEGKVLLKNERGELYRIPFR